MEHSEIVYLFVIANRKEKENLIKALMEADAKFFNMIYASGSIKSNEIFKALGLVVEQNKVIITCFMKKHKAPSAIEMLNTKFKFDEPNTGIAFTVPVEEIKH